VYRTLDTYTIKLSHPIHWDMLDTFSRLLEEHDLLADFRECFDALAVGRFQFAASCTYKNFKRFFLFFYQVFGSFTAEVSFNEDYPPVGCGYNTTVNFDVDKDGNYVLALLNILSAGNGAISSEEYNRRRRTYNPPFAPNCREKGNILDWNKVGDR